MAPALFFPRSDYAETPLAPQFWVAPGGALALAYLWLTMRSKSPEGASLFDLALAVSAFLVFVAGIAWAARREQALPPLSGILGFSLLFHVVGAMGAPILEDDFYRYLLDGWVFAEFGSPYGIAPASFFDVDPAQAIPPFVEALLSGVNNPEIPTIYGPTLQLIFRFAYELAPGEVGALQLVMAAFSFALVLALARDAHPLAVLFFAWHPMLFKEFANTAHPDVVAVLLMVLAWRMRARENRSDVFVGALLGLAVGAKVFAVLIVPVLLFRSLKGWLAFVAVLFLLYAPFAESMLGGAPGTVSPYAVMGAGWIFNAPLYALFQAHLGGVFLRLILAGAFGAFVLRWAARTVDDLSGMRGDSLFGLFLLCLPVLNPWYGLWAFVFWVHRPTLWLGVASISIFLAYAIALNLSVSASALSSVPASASALALAPATSAYEIPPLILLVEFGVIGIAWALDRRAGRL